MRVTIVYESLFGNTHAIAEAIGEGVLRADPNADVACLRIGEADPQRVREADLLVVGGPTHMHGMTSKMSRGMGLRAEKDDPAVTPEPGAEGPGVRDFLDGLPKGHDGGRAAAFDTRADVKHAGSAAKKIAKRLRRSGYALATEPAGFVIEDVDGPLRAGEVERAREWGAGLVHR